MNLQDPIVCTYVLEESGYTENSGLALAATMGADWLHFNQNDPLFEEWLASGYRKHFRRAKPAVFQRLIEDFPGTVRSAGGSARLWASPLTRSEEIPKFVKRLQMSNFSFADSALEYRQAPVTVRVNEKLEMSFGKAAVAAAHASQNLALKLKAEDSALLDIWRSTGYAVEASRGPFVETTNPTGVVEDFGITEVPAGSITAQASVTDSFITEKD
jgi:peptidyl-tRNA hydrolase